MYGNVEDDLENLINETPLRENLGSVVHRSSGSVCPIWYRLRRLSRSTRGGLLGVVDGPCTYSVELVGGVGLEVY